MKHVPTTLLLLLAATLLPSAPASAQTTPVPQCLKPLKPVGEGVGVYPGRVAWAHYPGAAKADEYASDWFTSRNVDQRACNEMVRSVVCSLGGSFDAHEAWEKIFCEFNRTHSGEERSYRRGEKIAIKINCNNTDSHYNSPEINATPQMVLALLKTLVYDAGVAQADITVAEPSRYLSDNIYQTCHDRFPRVRYVDHYGGSGREAAEFVPYLMAYSERNGQLARGIEKSFVNADYTIDMALLKGHVGQGVTLCGKNWYGCMDIHPDWRRNHHNNFDQSRDGSPKYMTFVDFMGHEDLGGKCVLYLIDGLYGSREVGGKPGPKWAMEPFGGDWPCSLLGSMDPVAIDMVGIDLLTNEFPDLRDAAYSDMYLHEAARADNPPSGTRYDPEGDGTTLTSLGVAEHWSNARSRLYSRNLGRERGIELCYILLTPEDNNVSK